MAVILVNIEDTFDQWRKKTNDISIGMGDTKYLLSGETSVVRAVNLNFSNIGDLTALTTTLKGNLVDAVNEVDAHTDTNTISIGPLIDLDTTDKSSIVNALNEVDGKIGDLPSLTTDSKSSLVVAINEVDAHTDTNTTNIGNMGDLTNGPTLVDGIETNLSEIEDINVILGDSSNYPYSSVVETNLIQLDDDIASIELILGDDALITTADYVTGAVNELHAAVSVIGDMSTLTTEEQTYVVGAINEIDALVDTTNASVGDLATLDTGVQTDLVSAINEVATNTIVMALILG